MACADVYVNVLGDCVMYRCVCYTGTVVCIDMCPCAWVTVVCTGMYPCRGSNCDIYRCVYVHEKLDMCRCVCMWGCGMHRNVSMCMGDCGMYRCVCIHGNYGMCRCVSMHMETGMYGHVFMYIGTVVYVQMCSYDMGDYGMCRYVSMYMETDMYSYESMWREL